MQEIRKRFDCVSTIERVDFIPPFYPPFSQAVQY